MEIPLSREIHYPDMGVCSGYPPQTGFWRTKISTASSLARVNVSFNIQNLKIMNSFRKNRHADIVFRLPSCYNLNTH